MTRRILSSALALALVAAFAPSVIAGELEKADPEINFYAMQRTRYDSVNNYTDFEDTSVTANNDRWNIWGTRTLVGMKTMLARDVWSKVEIQHIGTFGQSTPQFSEAGTFPQDSVLFQSFDGTGDDREHRENDVELFRAVVGMNDIGGSGLGLAIGRQYFKIGSGLIFDDEAFYAGTSFDGITGWYDWESWKLRGSYFVIQENNDEANPFNNEFGSEDVFVWGFDGTVPFDDGESNTWGDAEGHIFFLNDQEMNSNREDMVIGASWIREVHTIEAVQDNPMTWGIEIDVQSGEEDISATEERDTSGSIAEGWFGWNFVSNDRFIHRPEVGILRTSGDDDQEDDLDEIEGYRPWFGSEHCRLGCADFFTTGTHLGQNTDFDSNGSGITGTWLGYTFMTNPGRHKAWARYWNFAPTEDSVKQTTGVTEDIDDFGTEIDLGYSYGYSANARFFFTYAQFSPDDGLTNDGNPATEDHDDAVERIYGGLYLKFK